MDTVSHITLIPIIQLSISPMILVSGVGLLLLSMTNRFGRVVDRTRILAREIKQAKPEEREPLHQQMTIIFSRTKVIRLAITLATWSILMVGLLIILIFMDSTFSRSWVQLAIIVLFIASIVFLIGSLLALLRDIALSLEALKLEVASTGYPLKK